MPAALQLIVASLYQSNHDNLFPEYEMNTPGLVAASAAFLLFSLGGCAQEAVFSPPSNSEQVTVSVKVPKDLAADTMRVMYRSAKCPSKESADGVPYEIDGFYPIDVEPRQVGQSDLYEAKLARDGGGACQWQLSNVTFGVYYENTAQFGENVKYGRGGGVIVIFDNNRPQRRSMDSIVEASGNIHIKKDYYPWLVEIHLHEPRNIINILGDQDVFTYKITETNKIIFEPQLHNQKTVRTIGAKSRDKSDLPKIIYPDGSEITDDTGEPDLGKLQSIKDKP
ncbi:hypothetical protein [Pseudomonas sp. PDM20]|uniref:hypothetical protein n=1 Tax=Pseudomonas sp. PDM20 TaxID=2769254 RepID=UPI00177AFDB9|nr:hypothetical protein [Pseudomonas sp. PDM20]MBD9682933.1 hypothetical protein [Pseudomonas sp. PDM20]